MFKGLLKKLSEVRPKVIAHQSMLHTGWPYPAFEFVKKEIALDKQWKIFVSCPWPEIVFLSTVINLRKQLIYSTLHGENSLVNGVSFPDHLDNTEHAKKSRRN